MAPKTKPLEETTMVTCSARALARCAKLLGGVDEDAAPPAVLVRAGRYERAILRLLSRARRVDNGATDTAVYRTSTGSRLVLVRAGVVVTVLGAPPRRPFGRVAAARFARTHGSASGKS